MEDNIKILIIPDVHGREFWREPVKYVLENTDARIIFLGDYLDPYSFDFDHNHYQQQAIDVFNEIINLKKESNDRITLLLGNHDMGYRFDLAICDCRTDYSNFERIRNIFIENKDLFKMAEEETINGIHFIFSHAGIHKGYIDSAFPNEKEYINEENVVDYFNNAYYAEEGRVINSFGMYDSYRGYGGYDYGSIVWADVHSWLKDDYDGFGYQIFGHTQLKHGCGGLITENVADLDSAEAFTINELGNIKQFNEKK